MEQRSVILLSSLSVLLILIAAQAADDSYGDSSCLDNRAENDCACPQSCADLRPNCNDTCQQNCGCKDGTVDDGSGNCVKKEECCTGNTTYADCGNDCGKGCPTAPFVMLFRCPTTKSPGCFCKPGHSHSENGCILEADCP